MLLSWKILLAFAISTTGFVIVQCTDDVQQDTEKNNRKTAYRLPDHIIPNEYFIKLTPFIVSNNFTFNGKVKIIAKVVKVTAQILLNVDLMKIHNVNVSNSAEENTTPAYLGIRKFERIKKYQLLNITMVSPMKIGTVVAIEILYTGILNEYMLGFFRNRYEIKNETNWIIGTQLQAIDARKLFPCFDEPAFKAVFHMSVVLPKNYTAISNTNIKSKTKDGLIEFEKTPLMSTYLVAVVIGDIRCISSNKKERSYKVCSTPELSHQLPYALSIIPDTIDYFEDRLNLSYPISKLDMIALPDFPSEAMENFGLLVLSETNMLYEANVTALVAKKYARNLITHEIAHQWFGNIVTPEWWNCLWLSEGFASYFEYHAHGDEVSSWNLESQFVVNDLHLALSVDASTNNHPLTHKVYSPDEIESNFDMITYKKGASIVRMLEKLLGPKMFFGALSRYIRANQYSITNPEKLYAAIEEEIKVNDYKFNIRVAEFMNSWTLQSGFPLIDVRFDGDIATLTQKLFITHPSKNVTRDSVWFIPLNWAVGHNADFNNTRKVIWFTNNSISIRVENASDNWVIFNIQQMGFYRVNYDKEMWKLIINTLYSEEFDIIHEINRASLIDDLFNLGKAGMVGYDTVLSATQYLFKETNYIPWKAAFSGLSYLKNRLTGYPEIYDLFKIYVKSLLKLNFERLGFVERSGEHHLDTLFRELALKWLCNLNDKDCISWSFDSIKKIQQNDSYRISPNHQTIVYCTVIKYNSSQYWDYLWYKFVNSNCAVEKIMISLGLTCSQNSTNLEKILLNAFEPTSDIRKQDVFAIMTSIIENSSVGVQTVLDFIKFNFNKIMNHMGDEDLIENILTFILEFLSTEELINKFSDFLKNTNFSNIFEFSQAVFQCTTNEWNEKNVPIILEWLKINSSIESLYAKLKLV